MEGTVAFSAGPSESAEDYAVAIRFNRAGRIDALDGVDFDAATAVSYEEGVEYHFAVAIDVLNQAYTVSVTPDGSAERLIGRGFSFRAGLGSVDWLNHWGVWAGAGAHEVCGIRIAECDRDSECDDGVYCNGREQCEMGRCENGAPPCASAHCDDEFNTCRDCIDSGSGWRNSALAEQDGLFAVEFDATPFHASVDGLIGLSGGPGTDFTDFAVIVRFNEEGVIDARDRWAYSADSTLPYAIGVTYHVRVVIDVPAHTYRVYVTRAGGDERVVAIDHGFRVEQDGLGSLNTWGLWAGGGSLRVCDLRTETQACAVDDDCNDGLFCTGVESCADGLCSSGVDPCAGLICDEPSAACLEPNCDADMDGDGVMDCDDPCFNDPDKTDPGVCGCGVSDADSDADGAPDCIDACPGFDDNIDVNGNAIPDGCDDASCSRDADCDDGLFCNGAETCVEGLCAEGERPCGLGEWCNESNGTCGVTSGWTPPIGIPAPLFGIYETVESVYGSAGFFTHYVDNTHPSATDSSNPNGSPTRPRRTIPANLPAGSVVQVRGGVYNGDTHFSGQGTAQRPIFIVGINMPRFEGSVDIPSGSNSRYIILEGLHLACQIFISPPSHHISVRNSRIGPTSATGIAVGYGSGYATHLVIYNNTIADCGARGKSYAWNQNPGADVDAHGIKIDSNARDCWVVDNVAYHNYGNFIQLSNANYAHDTVMRTYIARNHAYENRQSAIGIKRTTDTFVSQNLIHGHHEVQPGNYGAGVAFQYGARNVWILCNEIYDNDAGVKVGSDGGGAGYIIGNLIYDCRYAGSYNTGSAWAAAAIMYWGGTDRYIANNTIYHCDGGIHSPASAGSMELVNNLIADLVPSRGRSVFLEKSTLANQANLRYCGFDNTVRIQWGSGSFTSVTAFRNANPAREVGCRQASNLGFQSPTNDDFHLLPSSPAVDAGILPSVYNTFNSLYGIDIGYDADGMPRPMGNGHDMGARER